MNQPERHDRILDYVVANEFISVGNAVKVFGSSAATIRRDFNSLASQKLVTRVRGGVKRKKDLTFGLAPFALREIRFARQKAALAREAIKLLSPGEVVIIDGGTTTFQLSGFLSDLQLRVITNSLPLAGVLGQNHRQTSNVEVFLTGGFLSTRSGILIGPQARASLSYYHAQWAFISASGINEEGLSNTEDLVVETQRSLISKADKVVVLADHSKIGNRAMCHVCGLDQIDILITDKPLQGPQNSEILNKIHQAGVEIIEVDVPEEDAGLAQHGHSG